MRFKINTIPPRYRTRSRLEPLGCKGLLKNDLCLVTMILHCTQKLLKELGKPYLVGEQEVAASRRFPAPDLSPGGADSNLYISIAPRS